MIPLELKFDKDGLLYLEDDNVFKKGFLHLDKRTGIDEYFQGFFYPIDSTDEYIIKHSSTLFTPKEIIAIKEMLTNLVHKQKDVQNTDFPIAYFVSMGNLSGLIIKYYKDGISLDNIFKERDMDYISKFYMHDDNKLHNLFMLYQDVLKLLYELLDNDIFYTDLNPGNIVITDNQAKLIDFDHRYVFFERNDKRLNNVMINFFEFVKETLKYYNLYYPVNYYRDYDEAKEYLKRLENKIRRGR